MSRRVSLTNIAAVLLALALGRCTAKPEHRAPVVITRVDTVAPAELMGLLESAALESVGLRAKLNARLSVSPETIIRTDTLVLPPDTVLQLVRVDGERLIVAPLIKADSAYAPELHRFDIGGCDDGWSWSAGELMCDRARLGHLSVFANSGMSFAPFVSVTDPRVHFLAGIEWQRSNRSPWRASLATDPRGRLAASVERRFRIF